MSQPTLSVGLMTYNEIEGLRPTVQELVDQLRSMNTSFEIMIIDDGSSDGTLEVAQACVSEFPEVRLVQHPHNLGLGEVYRTGFEEALGQWLTFFPADGQVPADCLPRFFALMEGHEMLLGYLPQLKRPPLAALLSLLDRSFYRLLFGPLPPFQGIFMVRTELLHRHRFLSRGRNWSILKEMLIRASRQGSPWAVVATGLRQRYGGHSKLRNLKTVLGNFLQALKLRWLMSLYD